MKSRVNASSLYTIASVLVSFLIVSFSNLLSDIPTESSVRLKCIWLLAIYAFYVIVWIKSTQNIFSIFLFFLLYTIFSNAGQLIIIALGINYSSTVNIFVLGLEPLNTAIDFQILSISTFCSFGMIAWHLHYEKKPIQCTAIASGTDRSKSSASDVAFFTLSVVCLAINLIRLGNRLDQSYGDAFGTTALGSYAQIAKFLFYVSLFVSINKHRNETGIIKKLVFFCMIAVGATDLLFGARSTLIPLVCGVLFLFGSSKIKFSLRHKTWMIVLAIVGIIVLNAFASLRQFSLSELNFNTVVKTLFSGNIFKQLISLLAEMGGSLRTLIYTIRAVDTGSVTSEPTILYTVVHGILPNQVLDVIGFSQPEHWHLSSWITESFGGSAGWGYSMTAEAYYNFGGAGFIFFALFGYVYAWAECKIKKMFLQGKTVIAAAWLFVIAYIVFLARADSRLACTYIRYAFYVTLIATFMRKLNLIKRK